jgi:hypothetical protein
MLSLPVEDEDDYFCDADRQELRQIREWINEVAAMTYAFVKLKIFDGYWISKDVPGPHVSFDQAFEQGMKDALACKNTLEISTEIDDLVRVLRSTVLWCRYWSVHSPSPKQRSWFQDQLQQRIEGLHRLRSRATLKGNVTLASTLTELIEDE